MKRQNRTVLIWVLLAILLYLSLLILLPIAERGYASASIRTVGDALWYSIITLTTIGYGDKAPVSPAGKLIGLVFVLCSIGVLAALVSLGMRLLSGTVIPRLRLKLGRGRVWYAFSEENADSVTLAAALRREDPDCLLIFSGDGNVRGDLSAVRLPFQISDLIRLRQGTDGLSFFCMGPDSQKNYALALDAVEAGVDTYCMSGIHGEKLPACLHLFSPAEIMSRRYWTWRPPGADEHCIVLIGCGDAGMALLERALITNVSDAEHTISYHVFGDTAVFSALHPEIVRALDGTPPERDRLILHSESWQEARALLLEADRVIVCCDTDDENLRIWEALSDWYVVPGAVHARLLDPVSGIDSFGGRGEYETPEYVMKDELNRRARLMNDIYNEGAADPASWQELSFFLQQSNIAAADHLIVKARWLLNDESLREADSQVCARAYARYLEVCPARSDQMQEMEHRRWMRFLQMYNWRYAPQRDNARRLHPLLLPYEQLSPEEKAKDGYAWEMLGRLGGKAP